MMTSLTLSCIRSPLSLELIGSVDGAIFKHALFIVHYTLLDNKQQKTSLDFYVKKAMREVLQKKNTQFYNRSTGL